MNEKSKWELKALEGKLRQGRRTAWMRSADLGDSQRFGVGAVTHAKLLPQSCFTRTPGYPPGRASAHVIQSSHTQKMAFKALARRAGEAEG